MKGIFQYGYTLCENRDMTLSLRRVDVSEEYFPYFQHDLIWETPVDSAASDRGVLLAGMGQQWECLFEFYMRMGAGGKKRPC